MRKIYFLLAACLVLSTTNLIAQPPLENFFCPNGTLKFRIYPDNDGDFFGTSTGSKLVCAVEPGYVVNNLDCDDSDPAINPSATEIYCDGKDNNCDGIVDYGARIYVKWDAAPGGNGLSWSTALQSLQDALSLSLSCATFTEVWVAKGSYYPDQGNGQSQDNRNATFLLQNGLTIYGGFAGTETALTQRNWTTNPTILSGEIQANNTSADNSYHVVTGNGVNQTAILDGFTIALGKAEGTVGTGVGGGIYLINGASAHIRNCTLKNNEAIFSGGGLSSYASSPTVTNCLFSNNINSFIGGGGGCANLNNSSAVYIACTFMQNSAATGGGSYTINATATFTNCSFIDNAASQRGGGAFNGGTNSFNNCIFTGNLATQNGGGMCNQSGTQTIINTTFRNNSAIQGGSGIYNSQYANPSLKNCIFWNSLGSQIADDGTSTALVSYSIVKGGYTGVRNLDLDPMFVSATSSRLQACSPAIDAGNNAVVTTATDLEGQTRIVNATSDVQAFVDMGAYEFSGTALTTKYYRDIDQDGHGGDPVRLCTIQAGLIAAGGDCDDNDNTIHPGATEICGDGKDNNCNGALEETCCNVTRIYVKWNAIGTNDGTSWLNAYPKLQDALVRARNCAGISEIWVATGTYYPDEGDGIINNDRTTSFRMVKNVSIYGGFTGNETLLSQRDWQNNVTVLSGDIDQNDGPAFANNENNSYHVVYNDDDQFLTLTAVLDGFTITGGNANHTNDGTHSHGGGIHTNGTVATFRNCKLQYNSAFDRGGGMVLVISPSKITNCLFLGNKAGKGGAISNVNSSPDISGCNFNSNYVTGPGGAISNYIESDPVVLNCRFTENSASAGGAIASELSSYPKAINSVFLKNTAATYGGALYTVQASKATVVNCSFYGNSAIVSAQSVFTAVESFFESRNSIIWGTSTQLVIDNTSDLSIIYTNVSGGFYSGIGNKNSDPLFADAANGDLHLTSGSPCVAGGKDDENPEATDIEGNPRHVDIIDMGAFESAFECPVKQEWVMDADFDFYYVGTPVLSCAAPGPGYQLKAGRNPGDCNDNNQNVQLPWIFYKDEDGDGYGDKTKPSDPDCAPPAGYVDNSKDCNDADGTKYLPTMYFPDEDGDGYGYDVKKDPAWITGCYILSFDIVTLHPDVTYLCWGNPSYQYTEFTKLPIFSCSTTPPPGYSANGDDKDDLDDTVYPGAEDVCDQKDNDGDGTTDEDCCVLTPISLSLDELILPGCDLGILSIMSFYYSEVEVNLTPQQFNSIPFQLAQGSCALVAVSYIDVTEESNQPGVTLIRRTFTLKGTDSTELEVGQYIKIVDLIDPTVVTKNITVNLDANGQATINPGEVDNGSYDNCLLSSANFSLDQSSFNCTNLGPNTVTLTVTDNSGRSGSATAIVTVVDVTPPVVMTQNVTVYLNASGTASVSATEVNDGSTDSCGIASYSLSQSNFNCSAVGSNTVTLTVTDISGLSSSATAIVTVVDTTHPVLITKNVTVYLGSNGQATVTTQQVNDGSYDNCSIASMGLSKTVFTCSDLGDNTVIFSAKDGEHNLSMKNVIIKVLDNLPPSVITKNVTIYLDANGQATLTASQVNDGSADNCSIPASGYLLSKTQFDCTNLGPNTVMLTVTDASNNTANANAIVTVIDNTPPNVITKNVTLYLDANGTASLIAAQVNDNSTDNCSIASYGLSKTLFTCTDGAVTNVTLTVTDGSGNSAQGTAVVTLVDQVLPLAKCKPVTVYLNASGEVSITASQVNDGSSDNCTPSANLELSLSKTAFSATELGNLCEQNFNVILTVKDLSGNTSTCSTQVTIKKRLTKLVYTGAGSGQYSDPVNLTAVLYDITDGLPGVVLKHQTVGFTLGAQGVSDIYGGVGNGTDEAGIASGTIIINQAPGAGNLIGISFAGSNVYCASTATAFFELLPEDLCIEYTGQTSVAATTINKSSCSATVVMSVGLSSDGDANAGDITKAIVEFNYNGTWIPATVQSLNTANTTGIATITPVISFSGDATTLQFTYRVKGFYQMDPECSDNGQSVINVYKPQGEFITGGGTIKLLELSVGFMPADSGRKGNFGFNVKYNQKNTNLQGNINYVFRKKVNGIIRLYQIKGNAMTSLSVNLNDPLEGGKKTAVFTGKCSVIDVTNPASPQSVAGTGNSLMQVIVTDDGTSADKYGISVWNAAGALLHSSNWVGTKTTKLPVSGNIVVNGASSSGGSGSRPAQVTTSEEVRPVTEWEVKIIGNPTTQYFTAIVSGQAGKSAKMIISDTRGKVMDIRKDLNVGQAIQFGSTYVAGTYFATFIYDGQQKVVRLVKQ